MFLNCLQKSLIAAINISFASGRGGVTGVSGNQATVAVMRGADVATEFGIRDILFLVLGTLCSTFENMSFWY